MASLVDIRRVEIGPENLVARVRIAEDCPLMTSEDLEATSRIYRVLPHIVEHACVGDVGDTFRDAMGDTELAHLLEHVTVELLAQTDLAGDMPVGRTWVDEVDDRTYEIELACPDDVLVAAALSSAAWIVDWAFSGGGDPEPDVDAIVAGLVDLVESIEGEGEDLVLDVPDDELLAAVEPEGEALPQEETAEPEEDASSLEETGEPAREEPEEKGEPAAPLWTPAPEVAREARPIGPRVVDEVGSEMEAEVEQIMATIEMPALEVEEDEEDDEGDEGDASA